MLEFLFIDVTEIAKTADVHFPVAITQAAHLYHVDGPTDQFGETATERLWNIVVSLPGKGYTAPCNYLTPCTCYTIAPLPENDEKHVYPRAELTAYFGPDENDEPLESYP